MKIRDEADLGLLILHGTRESIHLDFKDGRSLDNPEKSKNEIAKDVSAFANSDGGVIIYGMAEINHVADHLAPVNETVITQEWLEQIINSNIEQRIQEIKIFPIPISSSANLIVYVVEIPRSVRAPHMTSNKKFYKRFNFESVQMEEYEIRDLYSRSNFANLEILAVKLHLPLSKQFSGGTHFPVRRVLGVWFNFSFYIKNFGGGYETNYKFEIETDLHFESIGSISEYHNRITNGKNIYAIPSKSPLFQNDETKVIDASLLISTDKIEKLSNSIVKLRLYYSSGYKEKEFQLIDFIESHGESIESIYDRL